MKYLSKLSYKERERLFGKLRVSFTYHSSAIEGTTLTFEETKELLEKDYRRDISLFGSSVSF